jgi:hypothetical protein
MARIVNDRDLRAGDISELVILSVLAALGEAALPTLLESLEVATKNSKAPFSVGPSLEEILKWRESLDEVQEEQRGGHKIYTVTGEGKEVVERYNHLLRELYPNINELTRPREVNLP